MKKVALILSGCGVFDGSEIHESVLCLLAIAQCKAKAICFAPDIAQAQVINHSSKKASEERRSALVESARIARGDIFPLSSFDAREVDAILIPGGMGVSTTLSDFATMHAKAKTIPEVSRAILDMFSLRKPIGATCLGPILIALSLQGIAEAKMTMGQDTNDLRSLGMNALSCTADNFIADDTLKIYTTPAYIEAQSIDEMWIGIHKLVQKMLE